MLMMSVFCFYVLPRDSHPVVTRIYTSSSLDPEHLRRDDADPQRTPDDATLNQQTELTIIAKCVTESYNNLINNIDSSSSS